ncbi:MAG: molybdate ABC transporter substrate-binding protein [Desulfobacterales bacterium]|jgi:molybdate transport system substrate-binding protein|nr:molybdate ABC transporter substrate-binding protein [Desulfobacterales bacterium]
MITKRLTALSIITCFTGFFFFASLAATETLTLGAGAGYRRMLVEILKGYEQKTGRKIDQVYGHMGQIVMQAKAAESIGITVGELSFLNSSGLEFADFMALGQGVLVLAYSKNVTLRSPEDLNKPEIEKIAIPNGKQAIYGRAAFEFLQKTGLLGKIQNKIITVATLPQVSSYLISKDAEAGFINITDAIYIKNKIGGWVVVDKTRYNPIYLVIGVLKGCEGKPEIRQFLDFMTTDHETGEILKRAGVHRELE